MMLNVFSNLELKYLMDAKCDNLNVGYFVLRLIHFQRGEDRTNS